MRIAPISVEEYASRTGSEVGISDWQVVTQSQIEIFAALTGDHQFIHVDPVKAAETAFGGTIAHGMLLLSLVPPLAQASLPQIVGKRVGINYGFDRTRFVTPVRSETRVRLRIILASLIEKSPGNFLAAYDVTLEIEGGARPALTAHWLTMIAF